MQSQQQALWERLPLLPHHDDFGGLPQRSKRKPMILLYRAQLMVKHSTADAPLDAVAGQVGYWQARISEIRLHNSRNRNVATSKNRASQTTRLGSALYDAAAPPVLVDDQRARRPAHRVRIVSSSSGFRLRRSTTSASTPSFASVSTAWSA